jgi:hypothetical protein
MTRNPDTNVAGKFAIVNGAASGISRGAALAFAFAREGPQWQRPTCPSRATRRRPG